MSALYLAGIAVIGVVAQWLAWAFRVPAILFLLLFGLTLGPVTSFLDPDALLGDLLFPVVSLSVAVILFEGAMTLHFKDLKGLGKVVRNLCSIGMFATFAVIALSAYWILDLDWRVAAVLGAILVVTGPTVIAPLLNSMRPTQDIDRILRWEGIIIDPIGALFAVLIFEAVILINPDEIFSHTLIALARTLGVGLTIGVAAGWLTALLIRREWLPNQLHKFGVLSLVLITSTASNYLSEESGLLAVTVFGMWLANQDDIDTESILDFKEDLSVILISTLFILLAARLQLNDILNLDLSVILFLVVVIFVARPLNIFLSTMGSDLSLRSKILLSWIAPRGIVAAAVGSVFALSMVDAGILDAQVIVPLTFMVIIVTVVLNSLTAAPFAKMLGVQQPEPSTILLIGANHVARAIAKGLQEQDIPVYLSDPSWEHCKKARMEGFPCYYGNAQSQHAELFLPLASISKVLAVSPNRHNNALGVQHFAHAYSKDRVFSLRSSDNHAKANQDSSTFLSRQILFGDKGKFMDLSLLVINGGKVKGTLLTEEFNWAEYQAYHHSAIPLFIITEDGDLKIVTDDMDEPKVGDKVIALQAGKATDQKQTEVKKDTTSAIRLP